MSTFAAPSEAVRRTLYGIAILVGGDEEQPIAGGGTAYLLTNVPLAPKFRCAAIVTDVPGQPPGVTLYRHGPEAWRAWRLR